jgi:hypothetical protein
LAQKSSTISVGDSSGFLMIGGTNGSSTMPCHATASASPSASSSDTSPARQAKRDPDEGDGGGGCFRGGKGQPAAASSPDASPVLRHSMLAHSFLISKYE